MTYRVKLILIGLLFWLGSLLWLIGYGNEAPLIVYIMVSQLLASLKIAHTAVFVETLTRFLVSLTLFSIITVSAAVLYKQTVFIWLLPPKKPPAPPKPPEQPKTPGNIVIHQHFGQEEKK